MTDKTTRDTLRNANFQDTYIHTVDQPWIPFSEGIDIKVLRTSAETGTWSALFKCAKGSAFARHEHLGSGEYLMLTGKMEVRRDATLLDTTAHFHLARQHQVFARAKVFVARKC